MDATITVGKLSKSFGKKAVIQNIDLMIEEGQIYGLIGPSGSGKTTLVKLIVGIDSPDSGNIRVLNRKVPDPDLNLFQEVGYMAQSDALYAELTGKENLKFFASLYKMKKAELKERIAYVADLVKLSGELDKKVSAYSGGMKRRLSLAIALVHNPKLLVLDEPTIGIDPELRLSIWDELLVLKKEQGKTIIITTHVMDEAEKCDIVAMVRDGVILTSGSPAELKEVHQAQNLEQVFLQAGRKTR